MRRKDDPIAVHRRDESRIFDMLPVEKHVTAFKTFKVPIERHAKADDFFRLMDERLERIFNRDNPNHVPFPPL